VSSGNRYQGLQQGKELIMLTVLGVLIPCNVTDMPIQSATRQRCAQCGVSCCLILCMYIGFTSAVVEV
jgi:hypothetical protein